MIYDISYIEYCYIDFFCHLQTSAVLWLWNAHNKVNRRIAKDRSEDPQFPKIQFPSSTNCPECHVDGAFDNESVFSYLIKTYKPDSISMKRLIVDEDQHQVHDSVKSGSDSIHSFQMSTLSFTKFDISLCAVIYLVSSVILLCVLLRMILKKRPLRKFVYNIYGKI